MSQGSVTVGTMLKMPTPITSITADLAEVDRRWASIVSTVIADRDHVVATSGLSMAVWLAGVSRLPRAERTGVLVAADVLPSLPAVRDRFEAGVVSWPVVQRICSRSSRLNRDELAVVDDRMAGAIDHLAGDASADAILDVLDELLAQLRYSRERDRERRLERGEFLAMQPFLDGSGGTLYGEYGAVNYATIADAICAAAPDPDVAPNPDSDPRVAADNRRSIGQARAAGLLELCSRDADGTTKTAKVLATVSMETLLGMQRTTGGLLTRLIGGRMHLTAVAARKLADQGCDFRMIVHDQDGQTVGVGTQTRIPPDWLRDAVLAFNATCTCPGCNLPARDCDLDHAVEWRDGGSTDAGNLHPVHRGRHGQKTRRHWTVTRQADQSTTWTDNLTGLSLTQPSLWTIKALATGTHPACGTSTNRARSTP